MSGYIYQHGDDALIIPEGDGYVVAQRIDQTADGNWFWTAGGEEVFASVAEARAWIDARGWIDALDAGEDASMPPF